MKYWKSSCRGVSWVHPEVGEDLEDCRRQAEHWCSEVAGLRVHGTTRQLPRAVFEAEEQPKLQPYDGVPYDVPL